MHLTILALEIMQAEYAWELGKQGEQAEIRMLEL